jgi:hypothetical protein
MCATVCPSGALTYAPRAEVEAMRKRSQPTNTFRFGEQTITTKVSMMVPRGRPAGHLDVTAAIHDHPAAGLIALTVLTDSPTPEGVA